MAGFALLAVFVVVVIIIRLCAGGMDADRLDEYIRREGGELIETNWKPFGRGWLGEENDRIYDVRYRDRAGNIHHATVKTSALSGVYLTEDRIVEHGRSVSPAETDLELENARLRERIAELENRDDH